MGALDSCDRNAGSQRNCTGDTGSCCDIKVSESAASPVLKGVLPKGHPGGVRPKRSADCAGSGSGSSGAFCSAPPSRKALRSAGNASAPAA